MKVAKTGMAALDGGGDLIGEQSVRFVRVAPQSTEREEEHDPRGLVAALLFCAACWAVLGYFLLG
jgi:hypothetical protein